MKEELTFPLTFDTRKKLINILNVPVISNNKKCTLEYSIENLVISYVKTISLGIVKLSLPKIIE